ncbi:MAG: hypothetical protein QGD90_00500 [Candidatus Hydrogenedentes bacterium]|nr:hypothetical protein [Candidatus Hydrogenedentota bacterium]
MKTTRAAFLFGVVVSFVWTIAHGQPRPLVSEGATPFDGPTPVSLAKPSNGGVVLLQGNERLSGTVLNETFRVRTPYAVVRIDSSTVTEVELDGSGRRTGTIRATNGTRISGLLEDPVILFQSETDGVIEIPFEKALSIVYGTRKTTPYQEAPRYFFAMKNGDYFSGRILDGSMKITAPAEARAGSLRDMRSISVTEKSDQETWITIDNGDGIQGLLRIEDIALALEASPAIKLYDDRSPTGIGKDGFSGGVAECEPLQLVRMRDSRMVGYCVNNELEGVHIRNVTAGRPASVAGFQVGDWVLSLDGRPMTRGSEVWAVRDEIVAGHRQHLLMELRRGSNTHWYLLIK